LSFWQQQHVDEDEYGLLVERYWQGKTEVWSIGGTILTGENRSMEYLWNVIDKGKQKYGVLVERYWQGKTEVLGENPVAVSHCPPQILIGLARNRTRSSVETDRSLTARPTVLFSSFKVPAL
jgi:hypothetical protein